MKVTLFQIKKYSVRAFMAIGAMLGLSACVHKLGPVECVYGPPPEADTIDVVEDVYGPPAMMESPDSIPEIVPEPSKGDGQPG